MSHLDYNDFFYHHQHGFRKGYSCETQLFEFTHDLHCSLQSRNETDAIFLDFSKAFDRVPHIRLISKLSRLHLDPHVLMWIHNFLDSRMQYTVLNGYESDLINVTSGVPQGTVLGPLLFLIFINDLPNSISSHIRIFADDCVLYREITSPNDRKLIQKDLDNISQWCNTWLMPLNKSKCKLIHFSRKRVPSSFQYVLGDEIIEEVDRYKYLGVVLTSDMTWINHINTISSDTARTLGYIRRCLNAAPPKLRKLAYETFIRPKLEYASTIWNPHQNYLITRLEAIQNRATRYILSNYDYKNSVSAMKTSLNLLTLEVRRKVARLCLLHKLYHYHPTVRSSFLRTPARSSRRLNNSYNFQRISGSSNAFNKSFLPLTIVDWNSLPESLITITDPVVFKSSIMSYFSTPS